MYNQNQDSDEAAIEAQIRHDVQEFGWHVALFEETDEETSFAYTIGLWKNFGHPEIIAFGLDLGTLHAALNNAADKVREGFRILSEVNDMDIFEWVPVQFVPVHPEYVVDYFGYCMWFNEYKPFPAIQLVWSDTENKFPWEEGFSEEFKNCQPLLNYE